jgi:hypothetical protein
VTRAGVGSEAVDEPDHLHRTRAAYDAAAVDYARLLPDLRAETALDRAMLATFARIGHRPASLPPNLSILDLGSGPPTRYDSCSVLPFPGCG